MPLSNLCSWPRADSVYSILQTKFSSNFLGGVHALLASPDALKHLYGEIVVLYLFEAASDNLRQVELPTAAGLVGQSPRRFSASGGNSIEIGMT